MKTAWVAYQRQAHDLAFELFVAVLPHNLGNTKLVSSLIAAARRAGRLRDLLAAFERHAEQHPALFGRIARIRREVEGS